MAEYCRQCSIRIFGKDFRELVGYTPESEWKKNKAAVVICEGCGPIQVDPKGNCISEDCLVEHKIGKWRGWGSMPKEESGMRGSSKVEPRQVQPPSGRPTMWGSSPHPHTTSDNPAQSVPLGQHRVSGIPQRISPSAFGESLAGAGAGGEKKKKMDAGWCNLAARWPHEPTEKVQILPSATNFFERRGRR